MWRQLWIAIAVFVADQLTKYAAADYLAQREEVHFTSFFSFRLVHNSGAAFGFLSSASGWQNILFIVIALLACLVILWLIWRMEMKNMLLGIGLMLILGGAAGNLVDRLVHGYVIDFIDFYYRAWHWPAFNVADSAITVGAAILIWDALGLPQKRKP